MVSRFAGWQTGCSCVMPLREPLYIQESSFNLSKDAPVFRLCHTESLGWRF